LLAALGSLWAARTSAKHWKHSLVKDKAVISTLGIEVKETDVGYIFIILFKNFGLSPCEWKIKTTIYCTKTKTEKEQPLIEPYYAELMPNVAWPHKISYELQKAVSKDDLKTKPLIILGRIEYSDDYGDDITPFCYRFHGHNEAYTLTMQDYTQLKSLFREDFDKKLQTDYLL